MSSINRLLLNLSVKKKLLSGFAIVLAILLTISLLSFQALGALSERFSLLTSVKNISLLISDARQQEKTFYYAVRQVISRLRSQMLHKV